MQLRAVQLLVLLRRSLCVESVCCCCRCVTDPKPTATVDRRTRCERARCGAERDTYRRGRRRSNEELTCMRESCLCTCQVLLRASMLCNARCTLPSIHRPRLALRSPANWCSRSFGPIVLRFGGYIHNNILSYVSKYGANRIKTDGDPSPSFLTGRVLGGVSAHPECSRRSSRCTPYAVQV